MLLLVHMTKKSDFSKKILDILSGKQAVNIPDLKGQITPKKGAFIVPEEGYAVTRSIKNLTELGLIETLEGGQNDYARITSKGRQKLASLKLDNKQTLSNPTWDGKWRIILLDLPETRKAEREALRYLLKKAGFVCLKNSAYVSPHPFEFLFQNMKKDFGLETELMIIVTSDIDEETQNYLQKTFGLQ
jgi:DNA-binding transcriptional regulator PaaX